MLRSGLLVTNNDIYGCSTELLYAKKIVNIVQIVVTTATVIVGAKLRTFGLRIRHPSIESG